MRKFCLLLAIMCFTFMDIQAHPHVFIKTSISFVFDMDGNVKGFKSKWVFDENFSATIKLDYDKNHDGEFSAEESEAIEAEAFSNLKDVNYFTEIVLDGEKHKIQRVSVFSASLENSKVVYNFFVPFNINTETVEKKVKVLIYDNSYYIDVSPIKEDFVSVENGFNIESSFIKYDDIKNKYYFDQIFPVAIEFKFKKMW